MRRHTLRGRLNAALLQWFSLLVIIAGAVLVFSFPGIRRNLVDDRLLLAQTIAHSLDTTISGAIQDLGRLAAELPAGEADAASRLRIFRFQSVFGAASYVVDDHARIVAADPPDVVPLSAEWLGYHEAVTPLVRKQTGDRRAVVAMVEPFRRSTGEAYLISEMNPIGSAISGFLKDLATGPDMHVAVVDENGVVVASPDPRDLLRTLPAAGAYGERIRAHRPLVVEDTPSTLETEGQTPASAIMVMAPLRFAPWGVVIEQHNATAFSGLYTTGRGLGFAGVVLAAIGWLLSRTLSKSVVNPIRQLSRQAEAMRAGDLSSPITVSGDHEVEVLARTLNEARVRLSSTLDELKTLNEGLEVQVVARTKVIETKDAQRQVLVRHLLNATEEERRRLARELHDEISQLLTVIQLSLHRVEVDSPEMTRANELLTRTQEEIHRIIHDLRPSLLDDLGLCAAMKSYAEDYLMRQGLSVSLEIEEDLPPRPAIETVIFRIYQELVTNVLRHAQAEHVSIELYERDGKLVLAVEDDGQGFDPEAKFEGAGVTGMRERAALVNGTIHFDSEAGMGTHVVVEIPLQ
jgi:signal transduction histidine kinase